MVVHPSFSESMESYGTDKVGWLFAPIALLWFLMMGGVGTKALFANLDHFSILVVRIAFILIVFPSLRPIGVYRTGCLPYEELGHVVHAFYHSIPKGLYWLMFVLGIAAAIVGSHAIISATFPIIKQAHALGCFPRVKVVHISTKFLGQIYIPKINWILMLLCITVTAGFRNFWSLLVGQWMLIFDTSNRVTSYYIKWSHILTRVSPAWFLKSHFCSVMVIYPTGGGSSCDVMGQHTWLILTPINLRYVISEVHRRWENAHHRRFVAASLVQGVYVLERDRLENRQGPHALAS
ncbi:hypothetical protein IFM89_027900 [Coptis chinensis]|uniref:K+ potassium transporter integral membrane domain-containing protein n=1 Tax=Coptis chinensis TaxID=261450 RepID=A0A835H9L2_9MAGN|nr:hypothetical protein IFM89_027900 [Coptis chinensis]